MRTSADSKGSHSDLLACHLIWKDHHIFRIIRLFNNVITCLIESSADSIWLSADFWLIDNLWITDQYNYFSIPCLKYKEVHGVRWPGLSEMPGLGPLGGLLSSPGQSVPLHKVHRKNKCSKKSHWNVTSQPSMKLWQTNQPTHWRTEAVVKPISVFLFHLNFIKVHRYMHGISFMHF